MCGDVVKGGFVVGAGDFEAAAGVADGKAVREGVRAGHVEGGTGLHFDTEFW